MFVYIRDASDIRHPAAICRNMSICDVFRAVAPRDLSYFSNRLNDMLLITVTSQWARWRIKSPAPRLFTQPFVQAKINENIEAPRHWPMWGKSTNDRWTPLASNAENVAIWWRHNIFSLIPESTGVEVRCYGDRSIISTDLHGNKHRMDILFIFRQTYTNEQWFISRITDRLFLLIYSISELGIAVTSEWARWRLKSSASQLFTHPFIQAQIKENIQAPRNWPLCGEFTGDRWIPRIKGQ